MFTLSKYLYEVGDTTTYDPEQQGPITGSAKYWTGLRTGADVKEAVKKANANKDFEMAQLKAKHANELARKGTKAAAGHAGDMSGSEAAGVALKKGAQAAAGHAGDMSGSEAAGVALKKGAQAAGDAVGSLGKKAAEFAGDSPAAAGMMGGAALAALIARRKRNQA